MPRKKAVPLQFVDRDSEIAGNTQKRKKKMQMKKNANEEEFFADEYEYNFYCNKKTKC
jgi:hypothetical protein